MMTAFISRRKSKDSLESESTMAENQTDESSTSASSKYNLQMLKKLKKGFKKSQNSPTSDPLTEDVEQNNLAEADHQILEQEDNRFRNSKSSDDLKDSLNMDSISTDTTDGQDISETSSACSGQEKRKIITLKPIKNIIYKTAGFMKKQNPVVVDPPAEVPFDINQYLEQNRLSEAGHELLAQEDCLLRCSQSSDHHEETILTETEKDRLQKNYETLKLHIKMTIAESFKGNQERLKSAVTAIVHQEEQDRNWKKVAEEKHPQWRLMKCRQMHDSLLQQMVEERMQWTDEESGADKLSTSLKREVYRMGICIKKDLLWVVRNLLQCYPPEFDICNLYTQLYHKAFSKKLVELAQPAMDLPDCAYMLIWIHSYYPSDVLKHKELEPHINSESLEPLLPEEDLKKLLELYFSQQEGQIKKWWCNAIAKEKESWTDNKLDIIDGYHFSHLTVDIIPLINGALREAVTVSGNNDNAQRLLLQLDSFLESYKKCIDKLIKGKLSNIPNILKGNLVSIKQLREYIEQQDDLSGDVKKTWLATVSDLRDSCHRYFLTQIHKELKECYCRLWTPVWYSEHQNVIVDLLCSLEYKMQDFSNLKHDCKEELFSQLHFEVMTEYVRRMLKQKRKLKNKDEQLAAADFMCDDSDRINKLFIENGSKEEWLSNILLKMSEIMRLQDTETLKLEVVTFGKAYSDISELQLDALLQLKANLTSAHRRSIKKSLAENRKLFSSESTPCFFSKVPAKSIHKQS